MAQGWRRNPRQRTGFHQTDMFSLGVFPFYLITMSVRFLTFNVQGFRSVAKQRDVLAVAQAARCDLLLLQETNFRTYGDVRAFELEHGVKGFFSFGCRRCEGAGIVVLRPCLLRDCAATFDSQGRVVCFDFYFHDTKLRVINVYGPARQGASIFFFFSKSGRLYVRCCSHYFSR